MNWNAQDYLRTKKDLSDSVKFVGQSFKCSSEGKYTGSQFLLCSMAMRNLPGSPLLHTGLHLCKLLRIVSYRVTMLLSTEFRFIPFSNNYFTIFSPQFFFFLCVCVCVSSLEPSCYFSNKIPKRKTLPWVFRETVSIQTPITSCLFVSYTLGAFFCLMLFSLPIIFSINLWDYMKIKKFFTNNRLLNFQPNCVEHN